MIRLVAFLIKLVVFVVATFLFSVLFQYGIDDFPQNASKQLDKWIKSIPGAGEKPLPSQPSEENDFSNPEP